MSKAIMISIKHEWCAKIMNGEKTIEIRKNKALANAIQKLIDENGYADIYVYCSKDTKNLLHKNCADIYWVEDKDFRNKNKQLGLQTQPILNGKVLFKFRCYKVEEIRFDDKEVQRKACLTEDELFGYLFVNEPYHEDMKTGYAIHISDLEIFDEPKELSEFKSYKKNIVNTKINGMVFETELDNSLIKAPQNMVYVEVE